MGEIKTVIVVERNYLMQAGLEAMLMEIPGLMMVKTFTGDEVSLAGHIRKQQADVLILNPLALKEDPIVFLRKLKQIGKMVVFGLMEKETPVNLQSHFSHVLNVSDSKFDLQNKIRSVLHQDTRPGNHNLLSKREVTILKQVVLGLTNQEIADRLFLSIHTVTTHRKNINRKLGIKTVSGLTVYALMNHLVRMEEMGGATK